MFILFLFFTVIVALLVAYKILFGTPELFAPTKPAPAPETASSLDHLLLEKNRLIERLENEVRAERGHRTEFEAIKILLDEEIARLRREVRSLKGERESQNA